MFTAELAGVIVAATLVTAALIGLGIWMHFRRKKSKSQELSNGRINGGPNGHHPVAPQVSVISMETDVRPVGEATFRSQLIGMCRTRRP